MGERAARGADHHVESDAEGRGLRHHLRRGDDVAEPPERRVPGCGVNHVRPPALVGESPREALQRRVRPRLVLADGKRMQRCAEQAAQQQVARSAVEVTGLVDAFFELDVHVHPELAGAGRRDTDEVRLHGSRDQHRVVAARLCRPEVELELPDLVAPQGQPRAIVALDPHLDAEGSAQARRQVEGRRRVAEPDPREPVHSGKCVPHDGDGLGRTWTSGHG